jgi:glycosyltransferase involved in cell wall biosynthesis
MTGSKDNSLRKIQEICSRNDHFFYNHLEKKRGLSAALKAGIDHTFSDYVGYMDADLQTDPEDFNLLLPDIENYELVTGIRTSRKDSFFKNLQSKIANGYRRMMTHDGVSDTGCPLKVMQPVSANASIFNGCTVHPCFDTAAKRKVKQTPYGH